MLEQCHALDLALAVATGAWIPEFRDALFLLLAVVPERRVRSLLEMML
jgi:hypothetical protein